jgi:hypothetical protein
MVFPSRNIMLGGGLFTLPARNFARFNLMMFILFCLIIRTAYQGVQFNMMFEVRSICVHVERGFNFDLQDLRPKDIQTIEELFARNFTVHGYNITAKAMNVSDVHLVKTENEFTNRFEVSRSDFV